jgi:hypothetical protein
MKLFGLTISNTECNFVVSPSRTLREILWYSTESYSDTVTKGLVVVGKDGNVLEMIPHEVHEESTITPITNKPASRRPTAAFAIAPAAVGRGLRG